LFVFPKHTIGIYAVASVWERNISSMQ